MHRSPSPSKSSTLVATTSYVLICIWLSLCAGSQRRAAVRQAPTTLLVFTEQDRFGAVVGVQPFGGEGLSGTGPKAGGPHYLYRFCAEQTITVNTTAAGGNAALLAG